MLISKLSHKLFFKTAVNIDKRLHRTVLEVSLLLSNFKKLSIAQLGRHLEGRTKIKHKIKRIDRLFGNVHLHGKRHAYYHTMVCQLIGTNKRPIILVDWSGLTRCGEVHFLRASIPVGGRALTLFESTYKEKEYASQKAHRQFLIALKRMLPDNCRPIIVTDAGFRCPWFKRVRKMGWDFLGRVRHQTQCLKKADKHWDYIKSYYDKATRKAHFLFSGTLAKANPCEGDFYLYKEPKKRRQKKNLRGKKIQSSASLKHAKSGREPWMLFTSLKKEACTPQQIVALYKTRMQIEEAFRDLKNTNNGLSLRDCRSFSTTRLNIALLLAAIATFLLWIVGLIAKQNNQHYAFQANTIKHRSVLSTFTIGWQYLKQKQCFLVSEFKQALCLMQQHAHFTL